jgi:ABC-2 type transport system permease protein
MAAITTGRPGSGAVPAQGHRAGLAGTLRSEFTKIRSVRSTYWSLLVFVAAAITWTVADCTGEAARWGHMTAPDRAGFDPTQSSILGLALLGQLIITVLGSLTITSEYSTGMIRTSLTVMPRRGVLYGAKAAVFTMVALAVTVPATFVSFFLGQRLLASTHASATLSQPGVLRAVLISAVYVALCGLFAYGLGAILRHTAGVISAVFGILFLLPHLAEALPGSWYQHAERWLPGGATVGVMTSTSSQSNPPQFFSAWGEVAVFGGYTLIVLILGAVLLRRRDA